MDIIRTLLAAAVAVVPLGTRAAWINLAFAQKMVGDALLSPSDSAVASSGAILRTMVAASPVDVASRIGAAALGLKWNSAKVETGLQEVIEMVVLLIS